MGHGFVCGFSIPVNDGGRGLKKFKNSGQGQHYSSRVLWEVRGLTHLTAPCLGNYSVLQFLMTLKRVVRVIIKTCKVLRMLTGT